MNKLDKREIRRRSQISSLLGLHDQDDFQFIADTSKPTKELGVGAFQELMDNSRWTGFLQV